MNEISPYVGQREITPQRGNGAAAFNGASTGGAEGPGLRDYWRVLSNHKAVIAMCFFGAVIVAGSALLLTTPIYTAKATLLIERKDPQVVDIKQVLSEGTGPDDHDYYKTQYEILRSRSLAAEIIQDHQLERTAVFTGGDEQGGILREIKKLKGQAVGWVKSFLPRPPAVNTGGGDVRGIKSSVIDAYLGMLTVEPIQRTRLVKIAFNTPDPEFSARVANAHSNAYIRHGIKLRTQANQDAEKFLQEKLEELKLRVEESEAALNVYRREKGIISLDDKENIVVERLADLNNRLTEAEADRIGLEAQVRLIRNRDYDSIPAVVNSSLIQGLKGQLVKLEGDYANLSAEYKSGYPRVAQLKAQVDETRRRMEQEIKKVVGGITSAHMAAKAKETQLRGRMEAQKAETLQLKDAAVEYAILTREVDTNRQLYDSVLDRMKEVGVAAEIPTSNVFVIDRAEPPMMPSKPNKRLILLFSGALGLMVGLGLALFLEHLDETLKTPEDAERYLALPSLGLVPDFLTSNRRLLGRVSSKGRRSLAHSGNGISDSEIVFYPSNSDDKPVFSFYPFGGGNEAYRTLRTGIMLAEAADTEEGPRTVLFTSAVHGEGKTSTVVNSAITFAQMGVRVLLIDADLRRPSCHDILGLRKGPGIAELLGGEIKPTWAIQPTHVDNLFFISSGSEALNPTELIGSKKMRETLALVRQHYHYILIDSPPIMAVSDSVLLSTMVDGVVLVVGGQETARDVVKQACSRLQYARAKILGMVLNRMDPRKKGYRDPDYVCESYPEAQRKQA